MSFLQELFKIHNRIGKISEVLWQFCGRSLFIKAKHVENQAKSSIGSNPVRSAKFKFKSLFCSDFFILLATRHYYLSLEINYSHLLK